MKKLKFVDIPKCKKCGKNPVRYYEEGYYKTKYYAD